MSQVAKVFIHLVMRQATCTALDRKATQLNRNYSFVTNIFYKLTERRGREVSIPASYLGNTGFKYRPGDILAEIFLVFLSLSKQVPR